MKKGRVIDGDNMKVLEFFDPKDVDTIVARYRAMGKWNDVDVDSSGDVILFEDE